MMLLMLLKEMLQTVCASTLNFLLALFSWEHPHFYNHVIMTLLALQD